MVPLSTHFYLVPAQSYFLAGLTLLPDSQREDLQKELEKVDKFYSLL